MYSIFLDEDSMAISTVGKFAIIALLVLLSLFPRSESFAVSPSRLGRRVERVVVAKRPGIATIAPQTVDRTASGRKEQNKNTCDEKTKNELPNVTYRRMTNRIVMR